MKQTCIDAVFAAAGRALSAVQLKAIEDRISYHLRAMARRDRTAYLGMTEDQRMTQAAKLATEEFMADADKKRVRVALQIMKHDVIENFARSQARLYNESTLESLDRVLAPRNDGKDNFQSIETRQRAIETDAVRQMVDTFETFGPKFMGLFTNTKGLRALVTEMRGEDSSKFATPEMAGLAKKGAKVWSEVTEAMRQKFNAAGGEIGKMENWGLPQSHSQYHVSRAAEFAESQRAHLKPWIRKTDAENQAKWVEDTMPMLDRNAYVKVDGQLMNDAELHKLLTDMWLTIATGGANKIEPGKVGMGGSVAKRHSEERQMHFKDAHSYLKYQEMYGKSDAYSTMMHHISSLARDTATIEILGPNPDATFGFWKEKGQKEHATGNVLESNKANLKAMQLQLIYNAVAGRTQPIANFFWSRFHTGWRQWLTASLLESSYVTSITDNATMQMTAAYNNLNGMQMLRNQMRTLNVADVREKALARRAGLSLQTLTAQINRWGEEALMTTFTGKMSQLTMRASFLNGATEARRRAFGTLMYDGIGSIVRDAKDLASIHEQDRRLMQSKGVTDTDFAVWKQAELEDWGQGSNTILTPESIYSIPDAKMAKLGDPAALRREAALRLIGMVDEEVNMAVVEPGVRTRAFKGALPAGSAGGELVRAVMLFKSFPLAMVTRHWGRAMGQGTVGGKARYVAMMVASTTVLGMAAMQISNVLAGRDPDDMTKGRNWLRALLKGGSLGIYGDFLLKDATQYGNSPTAAALGLQAQDVEQGIKLIQSTFLNEVDGQKANVAAQAMKMGVSKIPYSYWYAKAALDRMIFNNLQEMVSPGYMARVEQRARSNYQQEFYWPLDKMTPDRAPDMARSVGQ